MAFLAVRLALALLLATLAAALPARDLRAARGQPFSETEAKALAVYQLLNYVRWPAEAFPRADAPLVLGIYGYDPFDGLLHRLVEGEKVGSHPLQIVQCASAQEAAACHLVFVARDDAPSIDRVVRSVQGRPVLTVSDAPQLNERGGIVRVWVDNQRIRLGVNLEAARNANLVVSAKLLRLAVIHQPADHP